MKEHKRSRETTSTRGMGAEAFPRGNKRHRTTVRKYSEPQNPPPHSGHFPESGGRGLTSSPPFQSCMGSHCDNDTYPTSDAVSSPIVMPASPHNILLFYGSYRADRAGIRLANYLTKQFQARGANAELIDAKVCNFPILDKMYKEYAPGMAPTHLETLANKIKAADAFVFVTGEYNWGPQPGLKNLTDHFLEEWFWRPAAIASYSAGRFSGTRSSFVWHAMLSEMGMIVVSSTIAVGGITKTLNENDEPTGDSGASLARSFPTFADDLAWWTEAAINQRKIKAPPF